MSLLVRSSRDRVPPTRSLRRQPWRLGDRPMFEFPPPSPPPRDYDLECDGGVADEEWLRLTVSAPVLWSASAPLRPSPLQHCPPPPFDCLSAGACLLTHSAHLATDCNSTIHPLLSSSRLPSTCHISHFHARLSPKLMAACESICAAHPVMEPDSVADSGHRMQLGDVGRDKSCLTALPAEASGLASQHSPTFATFPPLLAAAAQPVDSALPAAPPAPPAPSTIGAAASTTRERSSRFEWKRIGRGSLPPPPWPFFSRSSERERTSWTSLSAAAAANCTTSTAASRTQTLTQAQPPVPASQPDRMHSRQLRVCLGGKAHAVLRFSALAKPSAINASLLPAASHPAAHSVSVSPPAATEQSAGGASELAETTQDARTERRCEWERRREERLRECKS